MNMETALELSKNVSPGKSTILKVFPDFPDYPFQKEGYVVIVPDNGDFERGTLNNCMAKYHLTAKRFENYIIFYGP